MWVQQEEKEEYDKAAEVEAEVKVEAEVERRQKARRRGAHGAERECGGVCTAVEIHRLQKYRAGSEEAAAHAETNCSKDNTHPQDGRTKAAAPRY